VIVRRLGAADAAAFRDVRLLALRESPTAFGSSEHEEAPQPLDWFAARLEAADAAMFGAFDGDTLAGIAGVVRERAAKERHRATVRAMFVAPAYRGRGLGTALLREVLAAAAAMAGVSQVVLAATAGNEAALALYRAHGFTPYGRLPGALFVDGAYYDDVLMVRTVGGDAGVGYPPLRESVDVD
jgi:RimJ/RimL family protein N-acetyltransferase